MDRVSRRAAIQGKSFRENLGRAESELGKVSLKVSAVDCLLGTQVVILVGNEGVGCAAGAIFHNSIEIDLERILPIVVMDQETAVAVVHLYQIVVQILRCAERVAA